ncbi:hypothetical protein NBG4_860010 [Candidatus Sulfobium mesophilum]|uniref:Replication-associated protein ORF2/G2P domain-containing protein n=1 Tax=Candidatus Sulfobium mesophilum TaxID=2016548 RepID=A0A2U3QKZ2_9BACT|nr:hypothetical protein NBG4_860010 [Candidatus Sulfobium mesophilum]
MNQLPGSIGDPTRTVKGISNEGSAGATSQAKKYRINKDILPQKAVQEPESFLIIERYNVDTIVKHKPLNGVTGTKDRQTGKRGKINGFSDNSRKRLKFQLRNTIHLFNGIIALTYPSEHPFDGKVVKRDIDAFSKRLTRMGMIVTWVLEFQLRGAPHIHMLVKGKINKQWLSEAWYEIVGSKDEKHLKAGTTYQHIVDDGDPRAADDKIRCRKEFERGNRNAKRLYVTRTEVVGYMLKYFDKREQKCVPAGFANVGRFWGATRGLLQVVKKVIKGKDFTLKRMTRIIRRWQKAQLRSWGIRWKWRGGRILLWNGEELMCHLSALGLSP